MSCESVREQIPAYVLGALTGREGARLESHLRQCPECSRELQESLNATSRLAAGVPQVEPPPTVKAALLRRVRESSRPRGMSPVLRFAPAWQTALAVLTVVVGGGLLAFFILTRQHMGELEAQAQELQELVEKQGQDMGELEAQTQEIQEMVEKQGPPAPLKRQAARQQYTLVSMLAYPARNVYWAERNTRFPRVRGMVMTSPDARWGLMATVGLNVLPPGRGYQVWLEHNGERVSAGTFTVDESGWGQISLRPDKPLSQFHSVLVTVEPLEGSASPQGPLVFRARLIRDR